MKKYVYLAGPITGKTWAEANRWREETTVRLSEVGITCINPMRYAPELFEGEYQPSYEGDECFGSARAIFSKNFFDVQNCDMVIAYLPTQSIGTVMEIGWAVAFGKPVIFVSDNPALKEHPLLDQSASWKVEKLDDAILIASGVLAAYLRG